MQPFRLGKSFDFGLPVARNLPVLEEIVAEWRAQAAQTDVTAAGAAALACVWLMHRGARP